VQQYSFSAREVPRSMAPSCGRQCSWRRLSPAQILQNGFPQCLGLARADVCERVDANAAAVTRRRIFAEVAATDQLEAGCRLEFPA
jgi:hypothetical protein